MDKHLWIEESKYWLQHYYIGWDENDLQEVAASLYEEYFDEDGCSPKSVVEEEISYWS